MDDLDETRKESPDNAVTGGPIADDCVPKTFEEMGDMYGASI